jgi:hypothetical protein
LPTVSSVFFMLLPDKVCDSYTLHCALPTA